MNGDDPHDKIVRLEAQIDELADRIESCRKFILVGRIAMSAGVVALIAMLVGAIQANRSVLAVASAAVLGGIVAAGSNCSTAKEATLELTAAEAGERRSSSRSIFGLYPTATADNEDSSHCLAAGVKISWRGQEEGTPTLLRSLPVLGAPGRSPSCFP